MSLINTAPFRDGLRLGKLEAIQSELSKYRDFVPVHSSSKKRGAGQVLPFVRGLYFSAKIIYFIREVLSEKTLEVHWGHILHEKGCYCSPECDIIIHRPGSAANWNGNVLDFHFVDVAKVVSVISCKSIVNSVDKGYCEALLGFGVANIGLIGEVCDSRRIEALRNKAKSVGYRDLWCLALDSVEGRKLNEPLSLEFIKHLESL